MEEAKFGVFEFAPDITSEQMQAVFFDDKALRVPSYHLYQLNTRGVRYYYTLNDAGEPTFYPSVTTILHDVMPSNPFLEKWKADMGWEKANAYTQERAYYGTFMHAQIEGFLVAGTYDLDLLKPELARYIERNSLPTDFINYAEDLKRDMLSFAQFAYEYDVRPLCIEESLYSERGYAGMIDLVADIRRYTRTDEAKARGKKGEKWTDKDEERYSERLVAMIDFKSGRNGFYESHVHQLYLYKDMWEENFPDFPIDSVFNWSPKEWRKSPTFNFTCQDEAYDKAITENLLAQYQLRRTETKSVTLVGGEIALDRGTEDNYKSVSLAELVKSREEEKNEAKAVEREMENLFSEQL